MALAISKMQGSDSCHETTDSIWGQASVWRSEKWRLQTQGDWDNPAYLPVWSHTVREMWVLREVVSYDDCEWRQLIWKSCWWHSWVGCSSLNGKTLLLWEGCVCCPVLVRLRESPAGRVRAEGVSRGTWAARYEDGFQPDKALLSWEGLSESTWEQNSAIATHVTEGWFCPHRFLTS